MVYLCNPFKCLLLQNYWANSAIILVSSFLSVYFVDQSFLGWAFVEQGHSLIHVQIFGVRICIIKVKGHISRSLGLYKEFWHLDPCGQDIARTIWPMMLKLSVYTLYGQRKKPIYFQGQRSNFKVTGPLQRILALGYLWAGYSKNYTA